MPAQHTTGGKDPAKQLLEWIERHRRAVITAVAAAAVMSASAWFVIEYQRRKGAAAANALERAKGAAQSGNLPLAASDLTRLISSYGGTLAADEAVILRAQIRLLQDQSTLAVDELRQAIEGGLDEQFVAPAYAMLGTALETVGEMTQAGEAYENAANAAWYGFLSAQYLNDSGRAFRSAGNTARAVSAYERVLRDFEDSPGAMEARVRLAELKAASGAPAS